MSKMRAGQKLEIGTKKYRITRAKNANIRCRVCQEHNKCCPCVKSIKKKAEEVFPIKEYDSLETELQRRKMRLCYEDGANYVLKEFVGIVNKNTKPNGIEDRAKMASDMLILIKQLNK